MTNLSPLPAVTNWQVWTPTSYHAVHSRVSRYRGPAKDYPCRQCGGQATGWAYNHCDPDERMATIEGRKYPYSLNLNNYMPMCQSCHVTFDKGFRKITGR